MNEVCDKVIVQGALRVVIREEDNYWLAQGIEIDYATSGTSIEDVQRRFERGLTATIRAHLDKFHTIDRLLKYAPKEEWEGLGSAYLVEFVTQHEMPPRSAEHIPFQTISYLKEKHAACA